MNSPKLSPEISLSLSHLWRRKGMVAPRFPILSQRSITSETVQIHYPYLRSLNCYLSSNPLLKKKRQYKLFTENNCFGWRSAMLTNGNKNSRSLSRRGDHPQFPNALTDAFPIIERAVSLSRIAFVAQTTGRAKTGAERH
ncbi:hypothetical protein ACJJTC_005019 [Scirpophaga incertulas]